MKLGAKSMDGSTPKLGMPVIISKAYVAILQHESANFWMNGVHNRYVLWLKEMFFTSVLWRNVALTA